MRRFAAITTCLVVLATGCSVKQLQFRVDDRLRFVAPDARTRVAVPFEVRWEMRGFDAVGLDGSTDGRRGVFAVFVDRAPMPVGKDVRSLAEGDQSCRRDPRCPSAAYLAARGAFLTTEPALTIATLPRPTAGSGDEEHHVTIVLLDGTGRRHGESAWYRPFTTKRRPS